MQLVEKVLKKEEEKQDKLIALCKTVLDTHLQEGAYILSRNLVFLRFDGFFTLELLSNTLTEETAKEVKTEIDHYRKALSWLTHHRSSNPDSN
jgi:hypothetical protein